MQRRKILQLTGATLTTGAGVGYASRLDEHDTGQGEDENDQGENENGQDEDSQDEDQQEEPACKPEIQFGDSELLVDDSGFVNEVWAVVTVENGGDAASGLITVTAEWLDADGSFIDSNDVRLPSLAAGETWRAHVLALGPDPENIEDFEVTGEFELGHPRAPQGLEITESELVEGDLGPEITGLAENSREDDLEFLEAHGTLYDEDGTVLAGDSAWEEELSAETDWNFEVVMQPLPNQAAEPANHDVTLDTQSFQIQG